MIERKNPLLDTFIDVENGGEVVDTAIRKLDKEFDNVIEGVNSTQTELDAVKKKVVALDEINHGDFALKSEIPEIVGSRTVNVEVTGRENKISVNLPLASSQNPDPGLMTQSDKMILENLRNTGETLASHVVNEDIHVPEGNVGTDLDKVLKFSGGFPTWKKETRAEWGKIEGEIISQADLGDALAGKAAAEHGHEMSQINNLSQDFETISENIEKNRMAIESVEQKTDQAKEKADSAVQGLVAGSNITIVAQGNNRFKINSTGEGGGGVPIPAGWGSISGDIHDQADLQEALNERAAVSHGHDILEIRDLQTTLDHVTIATSEAKAIAEEAALIAGEAKKKTLEQVIDAGNIVSGDKFVKFLQSQDSDMIGGFIQMGGAKLNSSGKEGTNLYSMEISPSGIHGFQTPEIGDMESYSLTPSGLAGSGSFMEATKMNLGLQTKGSGSKAMMDDGEYRDMGTIKYRSTIPAMLSNRKFNIKFTPPTELNETRTYKFRMQLNGKHLFSLGSNTNPSISYDFDIEFVSRGRGAASGSEVFYQSNIREYLVPETLQDIDSNSTLHPRDYSVFFTVGKSNTSDDYYFVVHLMNFLNELDASFSDVEIIISAYPETAELAGEDFLSSDSFSIGDLNAGATGYQNADFTWMNNKQSTSGSGIECIYNQIVAPEWGAISVASVFLEIASLEELAQYSVEIYVVGTIDGNTAIFPLSSVMMETYHPSGQGTAIVPLNYVIQYYPMMLEQFRMRILAHGKELNELYIPWSGAWKNLASMDYPMLSIKIYKTSLETIIPW